MKDGGNSEEEDRAPCKVKPNSIVLDGEFVPIRSAIVPPRRHPIDFNVVRVVVSVLAHVFIVPGKVKGHDDHRGVEEKADKIGDPQELRGGEPQAAEAAVADAVDDRSRRDAHFPPVSIGQARKVLAVVEEEVVRVNSVPISVEDRLDLAVGSTRVGAVEQDTARGGDGRGDGHARTYGFFLGLSETGRD